MANRATYAQDRPGSGPFSCDTETCESCSAEVIELDQHGHCSSCAELDDLLRQMARQPVLSKG